MHTASTHTGIGDALSPPFRAVSSPALRGSKWEALQARPPLRPPQVPSHLICLPRGLKPGRQGFALTPRVSLEGNHQGVQSCPCCEGVGTLGSPSSPFRKTLLSPVCDVEHFLPAFSAWCFWGLGLKESRTLFADWGTNGDAAFGPCLQGRMTCKTLAPSHLCRQMKDLGMATKTKTKGGQHPCSGRRLVFSIRI